MSKSFAATQKFDDSIICRQFNCATIQAEIFGITRNLSIDLKTWWYNTEIFASAWRFDDTIVRYYNDKIDQGKLQCR